MVNVKVEGADRLAATLSEFASSLGDLSDAARASGEIVSTAARVNVPRRTGALAASMSVAVARSSVDVSFGAVYAAPIHWGVGPRVGLRGPHNIAGRPFLTDALASSEDSVVDVYATAVDDRLGRVRGA